MPNFLKFALVVLFGGLSSLAPGAEPAAGAASFDSVLHNLTLRQAEIFFHARNREIQLARRVVEGVEANITSAAARPNPNLSIATASISPSRGIGAGGVRDKQVDTVIGLSQLFERGGKRELRTGVAEANARASRGDLAEVRRQQRIALHAAYYDLVLAQEKAKISNDTAAAFQKTLDAVGLRLKAGDIAPSDVARISVDALRARNDARAAQAERDKARLALAYLVGAEREAHAIHAVDGWLEVESLEPALDLERVLEARADVQAALARVSAAEKNRELARAQRIRDVTAGLQYEHFPGDFSSNTYGIAVSIPLFVNYAFEGEIRRAEVELSAARENLERVRALARGEMARSRADLDAATERVRRLREALLPQAEKAADAAEFAYSRGAIGVMDLLDARRQLYAVRLDAQAAQADYAKSLAGWRAAIAGADLDSASPPSGTAGNP